MSYIRAGPLATTRSRLTAQLCWARWLHHDSKVQDGERRVDVSGTVCLANPRRVRHHSQPGSGHIAAEPAGSLCQGLPSRRPSNMLDPGAGRGRTNAKSQCPRCMMSRAVRAPSLEGSTVAARPAICHRPRRAECSVPRPTGRCRRLAGTVCAEAPGHPRLAGRSARELFRAHAAYSDRDRAI